jgi:hypothetical protein
MQDDRSEQAAGNSAFSASSDSFITTKVHAYDSRRTSPKPHCGWVVGVVVPVAGVDPKPELVPDP